MKILVIAEEPLTEWMGKVLPTEGLSFQFAKEPLHFDGDLIIDPFFESHPHHIENYKQAKTPVLIGSVCHTLEMLGANSYPIARFNWWPGVGTNAMIELSTAEENKAIFLPFLESMHLQATWLPDEVGFVTPRIIACIINEAFMAAEEKIADPSDIDTAMQLGTNYPVGPFAWCEKIGKQNVTALLTALAAKNSIYTPAASLLQ